jgi:hypothetical protein
MYHSARSNLTQIPTCGQMHLKFNLLKHANFWAHVVNPPPPSSHHIATILCFLACIPSHLTFHVSNMWTFLGCGRFRAYCMLSEENHDNFFQIFLLGHWRACFLTLPPSSSQAFNFIIFISFFQFLQLLLMMLGSFQGGSLFLYNVS